MTPEQEERLVRAFEMLAGYAMLFYQRTYPVRPPPRDIEVTHPLTADEKLRQDQGATGETTTAEWTTFHDEETDEKPEDGPYIRDWKQEERQRKAAAAKPARPRPDGASASGGRPPADDA